MATRLIAWLGIALTLAVVAAACGGAEPTPTPPPTATVAPTSTSAPTSTPAPTATRPPAAAPTATAVLLATATRAQPTATPAPKPKRGGALRTFETRNIDGRLDFHATRNSSTWMIMAPQMNWLAEFNQAEGKIKPDLATGWTVSSDGLTFTFTLDKNAKWQDGKPVTVDDVIYSFDRIRGKLDIPNPAFSSTLGAIDSYTKIDDTTLQVKLNGVSASFLPGLGVVGNMIYPKHVPIAEYAAFKPLGSGPYKFVSYSPDVEINLTKSATYWKKDEFGDALPYLDAIKIYIIADATAARSAYITGQLDVTFPFISLFTGVTERLSKDVPGTTWLVNRTAIAVYFNNKPPFTDQRIRTAFNLAFDRKAAESTLFHGEGISNLLFSLPGGAYAFSEDEIAKLPGFRQPKTADVAEANKLLDAFLKDHNLTRDTWNPKFMTRNTYPFIDESLVAIAQLKQFLGLTTPALSVDGATFVQNYTAGNFDIKLNGPAPPFDDPSQNLTASFGTGAGLNFGRWSDPAIDKALDEIERTLDTKKRIELSKALELKINDLGWIVMFVGEPRATAVRPDVRNYNWLISQDNQANRHERTWLDRK